MMFKRCLILSFFLVLMGFESFSQVTEDEMEIRKFEKLSLVEISEGMRGGGLPEQDCNSAIAVCQSTYVQPTAYSGVGSIQEVPNSSCLGSREKNSVWYIFTVQTAGTLDFVIDPNDNSDDYDFALYDLTGNNCSDIVTGQAPEVRCNYCVDPGNTGLSSAGQNPSEPCCAYDQCQFSTIMNVNVGETYVLIVSNYSSSQSGYELTFGGTADIFDQTPAEPLSAVTPCGTGTMEVQLSEAVLCSSIAADGSDFSLTGPGGPYTITGATGINCGNATSQVELQISPQVAIGSDYTLTINNGSDQNTLVDNCGNETDPGTNVTFTTVAPDAEIVGQNEICEGSSATLMATSGVEFLWNTGATTQSIEVSPAVQTTYSVTITSGSCVQNASFTVNVKESPIADFSFDPATPCEGDVVSFTNESVLLTSCFIIGGPCESNDDCGGLPCVNNLTFSSWDFGDGAVSVGQNPNHTYDTPGSYEVSLVMTDIIGGCANTLVVPIDVIADGGELLVSDDVSICQGESTVLSATGGAGYTWTSDPPGFTSTDASIEVSPTVNTTYNVTAPGCSSELTGSITVTVNDLPEVTASAQDGIICLGASTELTGSGASSYMWSPAGGLDATTGAVVNASPTVTTTYTVTGTDANNCSAVSTVTVTITEALQPSITADGPLDYCEGELIDVNLDAGSGFEGYQWSDDSDGQTINVDAPGTYMVTVSDGEGCVGIDEVTINQFPLPVIEIINDTSIIQGQSIELFATGGTGYTWSPVSGLNDPNAQEPIASPNETITYVVTVTDVNGCENRDTVVIMVEIPEECQVGKLFIPTAFSPNGDGLNDVFKVQVTGGYDKFLLSIRDRWGQTVFESTNINVGWDGRNGGEILSSDAFGYHLEIICGDRTITRQGSITLVR